MKHIKTFESLTYSGGDVEKMPIIGQVITRPMGPYESGTYDVVEIIKDKDKDLYVINTWYKGHIPNLIHEDLVDKFIPA